MVTRHTWNEEDTRMRDTLLREGEKEVMKAS